MQLSRLPSPLLVPQCLYTSGVQRQRVRQKAGSVWTIPVDRSEVQTSARDQPALREFEVQVERLEVG